MYACDPNSGGGGFEIHNPVKLAARKILVFPPWRVLDLFLALRSVVGTVRGVR